MDDSDSENGELHKQSIWSQHGIVTQRGGNGVTFLKIDYIHQLLITYADNIGLQIQRYDPVEKSIVR